MTPRRAYQGHTTPPGGNQRPAPVGPPALTTFLYVTAIDSSDHHQIVEDKGIDEFFHPNRLANGHHGLSPPGTNGSVPLFLVDGRVEIG